MRKLDASKKIALGAMATALASLALYAAAVMPTGRLALYFMSSLFVYVLAAEDAYLSAILVFLASLVVGFFIIPNKLALVPYAFLLGHFGIFKTWTDARLRDKLLSFFLQLLYCNLFTAVAAAGALFLLDVEIPPLFLTIPLWAAIALIEAAFIAFDLLYWMCQKIYLSRIRPLLLPRR